MISVYLLKPSDEWQLPRFLTMTITIFRNFDLLITRAGERYRAFVVEAAAGESTSFDRPFAPGCWVAC